jgi:hypothetical protein
VWYSFIAPASGMVTIETCSSGLPFRDSTLALYSGVCGSLVEVACDEDGCEAGEGLYSRLSSAALEPGQQYYICVMNPGDWVGSVPGPFSISITSP